MAIFNKFVLFLVMLVIMIGFFVYRTGVLEEIAYFQEKITTRQEKIAYLQSKSDSLKKAADSLKTKNRRLKSMNVLLKKQMDELANLRKQMEKLK